MSELTTAKWIEEKITENFVAKDFYLENQSSKHDGHLSQGGICGEHFLLSFKSDSFEGKSTLEKHRLIYQVLDEKIATGEIHSIQLKV